MNAPAFHDMIQSARCEGWRDGREHGLREANAVNEYDRERIADRSRAQGIIIGTCIGVFLTFVGLLGLGLWTL